MTSKVFKFSELSTADLVIDAVYEGGTAKNLGADPISKLMGCGNQGGFRYKGSYLDVRLCVLYSEMTNIEWPDQIDYERGLFFYYGDNKKPGHALHDTSKKGNLILKNAFDNLHLNKRNLVPPFFVFTKLNGAGRSVIFRGLAVPGAKDISQISDLVAIWKTSDGKRYQNYRATFTLLDEPVISRSWINSLQKEGISYEMAPNAYLKWLESGRYLPLLSPPSVLHRTPNQQKPNNKTEIDLISVIKSYFQLHTSREYAFEKCASVLVQMMDKNIISCENTRPWRDGGRDAIGVYRIGTASSYTDVEFALEAKCNSINNGCGVGATSRLISRLRHRQFGIFITTSYVKSQAYKEIIEDRHPVLILSGADIAKILISNGISSEKDLLGWLQQF